MAKFNKYEISHQFNHFTLWETLAYLIPNQDMELRERVYKMSGTNLSVSSTGSCLTGKSKDEQGREVDNANLWDEDEILDTDDPGFQEYCQSELDLLEEVQLKYGNKDGHGLMNTYIDTLRTDMQNLKDGIALETNICAPLFAGSTGLTKMKDVIVDLDPRDMNRKDPIHSKFKDTKVYEETAERFGITALYEEYNAAIKNGVEWQKQWQNGEPDPAKLEEIGAKIFKNIERLDKKMDHFEKEYLWDAAKPEEDREIYNITNHDDVKKCDLIGTEAEFATQTGMRAPNGANWLRKKKVFERTFEQQLLAAKLMKLQKSIDGKENPELRENMQKLIDNCTRDRKDPNNRPPSLSEEEHAALIDSVQKQASSLADKNPAAKDIVEATQRYKDNPVNQHNKADKWIESYQKNGFQKTGEDGKTVVDTDRLVDIMAARMLVNSVRGNKKSLDKDISAKDISEKASQLKNDPTFKGFLESLKDPKRMQKALSAAKSGHGGGLDDMLRDHVKNLPAGQLSNTPIMGRYMPTVKERIEALQSKVDMYEHSKDLHKTAAEIIALRNLAHAERGKKSTLDKTIPVADKDKSLPEQVAELGSGTKFYQHCNVKNRYEVINLIKEGHGGMLTENFRAQNLSSSSKGWDVLYGNSIRGRLNAIREEAMALRNNPPTKTDDLREKAGKLLAEYLTLDVLSRDPKTAQTSEQKLDSDIPYSKMGKAVEQGFIKQPHFNNFMKSIDDETLRTTFLDDLANKKQDTLVREVGTKISAIQQKSAERDAQPEKTNELDVQKAPQKHELGG